MRRPGGTVIGFEVRGLHLVDVDAELPSLWSGPRFRVPTLGLRSAAVAEIVLRARVVLARRSTPDVLALQRANGLRFGRRSRRRRSGAARGAGGGKPPCTSHVVELPGRTRPVPGGLRSRSRVHRAGSTRFTRVGVPGPDLRRARRQRRGHSRVRRAVGLERKGSYETFATHLLASLESGPSQSTW